MDFVAVRDVVPLREGSGVVVVTHIVERNHFLELGNLEIYTN